MTTAGVFAMGAWGTGVYDNDDAADWTADLASGGLTALQQAFDALDGAEYIESPEGAAAVAAADVVARLCNGSGEQSSYCEDVVQWVNQNRQTPADELVAAARSALTAVRADHCELAELWAETEDLGAWHATLDEIAQRLT